MKITLYSHGCPKCKVIFSKLQKKGITFYLVDDIDKVIEFGNQHNIASAPILVVDDIIMDFKDANTWINNWQDD